MTKSIFDQCGFISNDDRASGGNLTEDDILGCKHCQALLRRSEWKVSGGMCFVCSAPICASCYGRTKKYGCEGPFEKRIEFAVNDLHRREQNARILGI